jgi:hypothetical protein
MMGSRGTQCIYFLKYCLKITNKNIFGIPIIRLYNTFYLYISTRF